MERRPLHGSGRRAGRTAHEPALEKTRRVPAGSGSHPAHRIRRRTGSVERLAAAGRRQIEQEVHMFGSTRLKLDAALVAKVKRYADLAGYSSVEEFVTHALEKELAHLEEADSEEEIKKRLKGLGYIS